MRAAIVLVVTANVASAAPCVKEKDVDARIAKASAANEKAFVAALATAGYTPVTLFSEVVTLRPGVAELAAWAVIERDFKKKWVVGPRTLGVLHIGLEPKLARATQPSTAGFVRLRDGSIAFAEGQPHATSTTNLAQCECHGILPGVRPPDPPATQTLYQLPDGVRFAGKVPLAWDVEAISASYQPCGAAP